MQLAVRSTHRLHGKTPQQALQIRVLPLNRPMISAQRSVAAYATFDQDPVTRMLTSQMVLYEVSQAGCLMKMLSNSLLGAGLAWYALKGNPPTDGLFIRENVLLASAAVFGWVLYTSSDYMTKEILIYTSNRQLTAIDEDAAERARGFLGDHIFVKGGNVKKHNILPTPLLVGIYSVLVMAVFYEILFTLSTA